MFNFNFVCVFRVHLVSQDQQAVMDCLDALAYQAHQDQLECLVKMVSKEKLVLLGKKALKVERAPWAHLVLQVNSFTVLAKGKIGSITYQLL